MRHNSLRSLLCAIRQQPPRHCGDRLFRKRAAGLLLCALLWLVPGAAAAEPTEEARAMIEVTATDVLGILQNEGLSQAAKRDAIEAIAIERFDFETISKLVLKRSWRKFNPAERREFVAVFRDYLANSYGSRISRYSQEGVEVGNARLARRGDVTVLTKISGGQIEDVAVNYRLRNRDGQGWRIIDVVIEGISLVSNYHSQFSDVLNSGGPQELLERLKEKNAETSDAPNGL